MAWQNAVNSVARKFGLHLSRAGTVDELALRAAHLEEELHEAKRVRNEACFDSSAVSWFGRTLEEVERRYAIGTGSFLEPDGVTHTFTNMEMESARFLYSLILLHRPKVVVETGTHQGYSATYVAAALRDARIDGKIWTIDPFEVSHLWDNTPLAEYVEWVKEMSFDALDQTPQHIDFLILDSLHEFNTLSKEVLDFEPRLRVGGTMFLHDTLVFPEMSPVVDAIRASGRFDIVTFNTPRRYQMTAGGSGVTVAVKTAAGPAIDAAPFRIQGRTSREHFGAREDYFAKLVVANSPAAALDVHLE